jgi:CheY-like chemotaxis protein
MSADAYEEDVEKCRQAGMNSHISKPIDPADLLGTLAELRRGEGRD